MNKFIARGLVVLFAASLFTACPARPDSNANVSANTAGNSNSATNGNSPVAPASAGAESQSATAESVVAELYKIHDTGNGPFFQDKNRALVDKFFTKTTADLLWKEATNKSGEMGAIGMDPLYDAQDTQIKNFSVGKADVKGETATVIVSFVNFGEKGSVTLVLKRVASAWKVDDVKYRNQDSLLTALKDFYGKKTGTTTASTGDFEGKYQVGDTTCTVTPVRQGFEVKWAKGSGVEMFFVQSATSFASKFDDPSANRFEFDDENFNTGTFYRQDGKTFAVKRAK